MKYLIINADDFAITKSVDDGIALAYTEGIVKSVSIMPSGDAFNHAFELSKKMGIKDIGVHLALTETAPVSDPSVIKTLVTKNGFFRKGHNLFFAGLLVGSISKAEIYKELRNQMNRALSLKLEITHLSSHEHIHMMPDILEIFINIAREYKVPAIRCLCNDRVMGQTNIKAITRVGILKIFESKMKTMLDDASVLHPDNLAGFIDSGRLNEEILLNVIEGLEEGVTELVCHPGFLGPDVLKRYKFHINSEYELFALTSPRVKKSIKSHDIKLISYPEFLAMRNA